MNSSEDNVYADHKHVVTIKMETPSLPSEDNCEESLSDSYDIFIGDNGTDMYACRTCPIVKMQKNEILDHLKQHLSSGGRRVYIDLSDDTNDSTDTDEEVDNECLTNNENIKNNSKDICGNNKSIVLTLNWEKFVTEKTNDNKTVFFCRFSNICHFKTGLRLQMKTHISQHLDPKVNPKFEFEFWDHCLEFDGQSPQSESTSIPSKYNKTMASKKQMKNKSRVKKFKTNKKSNTSRVTSRKHSKNKFKDQNKPFEMPSTSGVTISHKPSNYTNEETLQVNAFKTMDSNYEMRAKCQSESTSIPSKSNETMASIKQLKNKSRVNLFPTNKESNTFGVTSYRHSLYDCRLESNPSELTSTIGINNSNGIKGNGYKTMGPKGLNDEMRDKCKTFINRNVYENIEYLLCSANNCLFTTKFEDKIYSHILDKHLKSTTKDIPESIHHKPYNNSNEDTLQVNGIKTVVPNDEMRAKCQTFIKRHVFEGIEYLLCSAHKCLFTTKIEDKIFAHIINKHLKSPTKDSSNSMDETLLSRSQRKRKTDKCLCHSTKMTKNKSPKDKQKSPKEISQLLDQKSHKIYQKKLEKQVIESKLLMHLNEKNKKLEQTIEELRKTIKDIKRKQWCSSCFKEYECHIKYYRMRDQNNN